MTEPIFIKVKKRKNAKIENKKFVIDTTTAPIVKEIFQRYADGEDVRSIAEDLNRRGFKSAKGLPFNKNSFQNMLKNEKLANLAAVYFLGLLLFCDFELFMLSNIVLVLLA